MTRHSSPPPSPVPQPDGDRSSIEPPAPGATAPPVLTDTDRVEQAGEVATQRLGWVWRILIGAALLGLAVVWSYALWGPRSDPPGTMDDPSFGEAAEQVCAPVRDRIDALPFAHETPDPHQRAAVVDEANDLLAGQLASLAPLVTLTDEGSEDRRRVTEWLGDWDTYLEDRRAYPVALRADPATRFTQSEKGGRGIATALDEFARKNAMASCATPGDVG
jgi:hypothetical protein